MLKILSCFFISCFNFFSACFSIRSSFSRGSSLKQLNRDYSKKFLSISSICSHSVAGFMLKCILDVLGEGRSRISCACSSTSIPISSASEKILGISLWRAVYIGIFPFMSFKIYYYSVISQLSVSVGIDLSVHVDEYRSDNSAE